MSDQAVERAAQAMRELAEAALTASERPTTTTPESRGRIAHTAYCRAANGQGPLTGVPLFDDLPPILRDAWIKAANVIWDLATTGHASL